ncbi:MFS-type transporter involved in bile tolerance (Atg22 family) [Tahibacter aquaticus]|uniref:MFS-type transporter involved in bile tolerance (Atg22 family) n=1 Tax=Tahibacter aquaticus TaxID=520092 RepID=A0A4R6YRH0_9GAMM|nr:MFS transporter [Tahibacter aquaticus]TDR40705.1 MFS-type transporter involved in bile tolerance (Atg22 family) [Tahibacter aquaticus]
MIRSALNLPRTVWLLGLVSLVNDSASDMIYPLVPLYLASVLMAGPKALGLIEGLAEALGAVLKLFAGVLADRLRQMRWWVVAGYALSGVVRPLLALTTSWLGVLLCRFGDRVGKGLRAAPRDALLSLSVAPQQRGLAFGLHRSMDNLGAVIGPLLAAALLGLGFSLREVFFAALVPALAVVVLTLFVREPERVVLKPKPFRWNLSDQPPALRRYLVVLALFTLGNSSNMFLLLRARELGLADAQIPLLWALVCAIAALFGTPLSALSDRLDRRRLIVAGWSLYAGFYLLFGLLPAQPWLLWPMFAGYGLFLAATEGAEKALVADLVPGEQAGTAFGWYNLVAGVLLLPASLLFGWLWEVVTPLAAFAFGSACALLAAALLAWWVPRAGQGRVAQPAG